ncbi:MAG TPA: c-type cytochrome [Lunatimonas sp.]|nr:c-type cytochrome [Lunatimonas sp.]
MNKDTLQTEGKKIGIVLLLGFACLFLSCEKYEEKEVGQEGSSRVRDYIRPIPGEDEEIAEDQIKLGEVLIAYSDCYDCHTRENRAKGPSFQDISKRYPIRQVYIDLLARKVISGGTGSWGYPIMNPHPNVSMEDAQTMVTFILSLKHQKN